jgi:hypothetical protein
MFGETESRTRTVSDLQLATLAIIVHYRGDTVRY